MSVKERAVDQEKSCQPREGFAGCGSQWEESRLTLTSSRLEGKDRGSANLPPTTFWICLCSCSIIGAAVM